MPVRDPLAAALCLGLLAGALGMVPVRRGRRGTGALLAAAAAGSAAALLERALGVGAGASGGAAAAAAAAACALVLPGRAGGRSGLGRAFGRAGFSGSLAEARLPGRLAGATPSRLVDPADALRLESAALRAEAKAEVEIAVAVVERCGEYADAAWRAAAWLSALLLSGAAAGAAAPRVGLAAAAGGAALGLAAARAPRLRRLLVADAALARRAEARALDAFARAGVGRSPGGAGLLVFAALFEGRVLALAGPGLRADPHALEAVARTAAGGLAGDVPDGLVRAVEAAGEHAAALRPRGESAPAGGRPPPVFVED